MKALVDEWRRLGPVRWAEHRYGWIMQDGEPIRLEAWQRAVLEAWWKHRATTTTLAISNVKKTGKTTLNAVLGAWRWLTMPGEHYACANDLDQSQGRQFQMVARMVARHPLLRQHVKATRTRLVFEPTGSILEALEVDPAGRAGANHLTSSHTEAWGIQYEAGRRAYEELTPQPGLFYGLPAMRIVDSYAGWEGESETWHDLVDRGLAGKRVDRKWPIYRAGGLLLFHIEGEEAQEQCFRGTPARRRAYYKDQRAELRPGAYKRLHLNQRASGEGAFITPEQWEACVLDGYRIPGPNRELDLSVGIDLAIKHDYAGVVSVFQREDLLWIGPWRVWRPEPTVDLESVEQYLLNLQRNYGRLNAAADPYQAGYLIERCERRGLRIEEYPQTVSNLTTLGNTLFDTLRQGRLVVPGVGAEELRRHVLNCNARETNRGIRLIKSSHGGKIDLAIALGEAVVTAKTGRQYGPPKIVRYA